MSKYGGHGFHEDIKRKEHIEEDVLFYCFVSEAYGCSIWLHLGKRLGTRWLAVIRLVKLSECLV